MMAFTFEASKFFVWYGSDDDDDDDDDDDYADEDDEHDSDSDEDDDDDDEDLLRSLLLPPPLNGEVRFRSPKWTIINSYAVNGKIQSLCWSSPKTMCSLKNWLFA